MNDYFTKEMMVRNVALEITAPEYVAERTDGYEPGSARTLGRMVALAMVVIGVLAVVAGLFA